MHALWGMGQMMYTKLLIVVDGDVDAQDLSPPVAWKVFNNIDAARDVTIVTVPWTPWTTPRRSRTTATRWG
jgi:4-hydroxy-3-polyprenylbenzoate decarboxylase